LASGEKSAEPAEQAGGIADGKPVAAAFVEEGFSEPEHVASKDAMEESEGGR
jgi:hypothetical protein